nr:MAG TPA: hypothetical protein [Caudoviricetes sp.]
MVKLSFTLPGQTAPRANANRLPLETGDCTKPCGITRPGPAFASWQARK